jgi:hypothetical protein
VIDVSAVRLLLVTLAGWLDRQEREVISYLIAENRILRRQLRGQRLRLTDHDRRQLAARAYRLGRRVLREVATIVTPDTLLRWHRQLIARNRLIPLGERHFRRAVSEFVNHYHHERNHQGLNNELIEGVPAVHTVGGIHRRQRLSGLLNYYGRAA